MTRGGARPGAGRPHKVYGDVDRRDLLAALAKIVSPATVEALFIDGRNGNIAALRKLVGLYERARLDAIHLGKNQARPMLNIAEASASLFERDLDQKKR